MDFRDIYCPQLAKYNPAADPPGIDLSVIACDCPPAPAAEMACMGPPECEGKPEGECGDTNVSCQRLAQIVGQLLAIS